MKRIIVTGGAGFLGSHLCEKLLNEGNYVICVDNLYTGNEKNIAPFKSNKNFEFVKHDIINPLDIKCDEIYNMACPASPVHYQKDPIYTFKTSVLGILNMLELARKYNAKILQASTSEVYGDPIEHPQKEIHWGNVNCNGIRSCYDEGKRSAETLIFDYNRMYKTKIKVVRIFNTYGPNMDKIDGRVVSNFIIQALANEDITVYGDGGQTRSFCYSSDLIDGIYKTMNSEDNFLGPVNLGNPVEYTILDFAKTILDYTKSKSKIIHKPLPQDDPTKRKPDITLAKTVLNWEPKVSLKEGIEKTTDYFKSLMK